MNPTHHNDWRIKAIWVLFALLAMRVLLMWYVPLTDTTEARYAEIARKMLETGNWVTPLHDYAVPFWGKPPLFAWLSAASMGLFGVNQLAVRLPSLLLGLGTLWLVFDLARHHSGRETAWAAVLLLAGGLLFFVTAGTVMTDPALLFCITLTQVAFWHALAGGQSRTLWGYLFFVGLGLGLLAKGPVAIVLNGLPIFFWVLLRNQWRALWHHLPWIRGTLLMLAIALPWYLLAEQRTPGFLDYFVVGENFSRFVVSGWKGDKYGFAHITPVGMIWLLALLGLLPWSALAPLWLWRQRGKLRSLTHDADGWVLYLALWSSMLLFFFTLSSHAIFPYPLPMLPGAALLMAELWQRARQPNAPTRLPALALVIGVIFTLAIPVIAAQPGRFLRTQEAVIAAWQAQQPSPQSALVYWNSRREFSAEFYSSGRAKSTEDAAQLQALIAGPSQDFLLVRQKDLLAIPAYLMARFEPVNTITVTNKPIVLLRERPEYTATPMPFVPAEASLPAASSTP